MVVVWAVIATDLLMLVLLLWWPFGDGDDLTPPENYDEWHDFPLDA